MKLSIKEIKEIGKQYEEESYDEELEAFYHEAVMDELHGDWGCRDED